MNKLVFVLLITFGVLSCKTSENEIDNLEIAKDYYSVLNNSDHTRIKAFLIDSLFTADDTYKQTFTLKEYQEWMQWDSLFHPTYKILDIQKENNTVKAKISKTDKRILFLHEAPIVTHEVLHFDNNKIISIERNTLVFNADTFVKNRDSIVNYIHETHPELNGFLHDQSIHGGLKYLKAIERFKHRKY